jgi:DNA mismatch repair ATPase MutL
MPVRRQFYNTNKKKKEELKKMEDLIVAFSVILPKVRFTGTYIAGEIKNMKNNLRIL